MYSPRRSVGLGLTDGEVMERLWSCLRGFASITKEMSPSRRIDALTDCLLHYGQQIKSKLASRLKRRMLRAKNFKKQQLRLLMNLWILFPIVIDN